jgi:hypothetical protein
MRLNMPLYSPQVPESYELFVKGAPVAKEGGPDRSAHSDWRNASSARLSVGVSLEKRSVTSSASFW